MSHFKIGEFTFTEAQEFRLSYETASWYRLVRIEAGTYPVYAHSYPGNEFGHTLYITAEGVCTSSYFVSRLFNASNSEVDRDVGKRFTAWRGFPPYDIGAHLDSGALKLASGFEAVPWGSKGLRRLAFEPTPSIAGREIE